MKKGHLDFIPQGKKYPDLEVLFCGCEACESGHTYGPHIRDYHLIHYVREGEGVFYDGRGEHRVRKGEIFIIQKGEITTYRADEKHPWEYIWIALRGVDEDDFRTLPSVLPYPNTTFLAIEEGLRAGYAYTFFESRAYSLLFHLFEKQETLSSPEVLLYEYIELKYMLPFSMDEVARGYGFDRSYLGRIFKKRYGISPREHLLSVRLSHAKEFLLRGYTVGECASLCGYTDMFQFSKIFRKEVGKSPSEYRKEVAK